MTTATFHFDGIVTIKGSGLRGARRAAAKAHNASLRANARPRDDKGRFVMTDERITNEVAARIEAEDLAYEAWLAADVNSCPIGMTHVDELSWTGRYYNADDDVTHAHHNCTAIAGGGSYGVHVGWLCETCVFVPKPVQCPDQAPRHGVQTCVACHVEQQRTAFDTLSYDGRGYKERSDTCRRCEETRRAGKRAGRQIAA